MRLLAIVLLAATISNGAVADDGGIYRCVVSDFRHGGPDFGADLAFKAANMKKTFDIFDLGAEYKVIMNTKDFAPSTYQYEILTRGILGTAAVDQSAISDIHGLVVYVPQENSLDTRVTATISRQSHASVNVWYLTCVTL